MVCACQEKSQHDGRYEACGFHAAREREAIAYALKMAEMAAKKSVVVLALVELR